MGRRTVLLVVYENREGRSRSRRMIERGLIRRCAARRTSRNEPFRDA